jgi:hypothetical protein
MRDKLNRLICRIIGHRFYLPVELGFRTYWSIRADHCTRCGYGKHESNVEDTISTYPNKFIDRS